MEKILAENISYIPTIEEPLSSDVIIVRGKENTYIFDVGNNNEVTDYLNALPGKKTVIISHFHADHAGKLAETECEKIYVGNQTKKSLGLGDVITKPLTISDGIKIDIIPCASSHAKGSLLMMIDDTYLFTGDSLYSAYKDNNAIYNVSLLSEQIRTLKALPATKYFLDHRKGRFLSKELNIRQLETVYQKRLPGEAFITIPY